jgi:hypothetical protein
MTPHLFLDTYEEKRQFLKKMVWKEKKSAKDPNVTLSISSETVLLGGAEREEDDSCAC